MKIILFTLMMTSCATTNIEQESRISRIEQELKSAAKQLRETRCFLDYVMCKDSANKEHWTGLALCKGTLDGCLNNTDSSFCDPNFMFFYPKGKIIPSEGSCPSRNTLDLPTVDK